MKPAYLITAPTPAQIAALPPIERAAADQFTLADLPLNLRENVTPVEIFAGAREEERLWVAVDAAGQAVGFALISQLDDAMHLDELDVHPAHARQGIGRALVLRVLGAVAERDIPAVTLTTFRHIPWNGPFYESCGFRELQPSGLTPGLAAKLAKESERGLDPATRIAMRCELRRCGASS